jgi:hypothetical protein
VPDEDGDAYARRLDRKLRQTEDLARLSPQLVLLVELVADEVPVQGEVSLHRLDGAQPLDAGIPRP